MLNAPGSALLRPLAENNLKVLRILLNRRFDGNWEKITQAWYHPKPPLAAVQTGNPEIVNLFIASDAPFAEHELRLAVRRGYKEIVEMLLEHGVTANVKILDVAVKEGHQEIVKLLLARGVETNPYAAAMTGDMATVKEYLEGRMDVDDAKSYRYPTLLKIAAGTGQKPMVEYLLRAGVEVNTRFEENLASTALHTAVRSRNVNFQRCGC